MRNVKVPLEKRKRVSKACNTCMKRKQKCDGQKNCSCCRKKGITCVYRPSKSTESSSDSTVSCSPPNDLGEQSPEAVEYSDTPDISGKVTMRRSESPGTMSRFRIVSTSRPGEFGKYTHPHTASDHQLITLCLPLPEPPLFSHCYATESFVALVKKHVERGSGSSGFTESSCIRSESQQTSPASPYPIWPPDLPRITIERLVKSYFTNAKTLGFIDVISSESVGATLRQMYNGPSQVYYSERCIIYLVLAIGLTFDFGPAEGALQDPNLKEQFFASAEALLQPIETQRGTKSYNGVPWTLQALVLMSLYMLCVSRRHAAHSYCGRAFEVAQSFGIHRGKEAEGERFSGTQSWIVSRRSVWRSLFVLDRFLAATLGRPLTFHQHTEESLKLKKRTPLNFVVDACRIIDETVKVIYSGSEISMKKVLLGIGYLDLLTDANVDPAHSVAQVRVDPLRFYADILLCRPFFLLRFIASTQEREALDDIEPQINKLSQRCVSKSMRVIEMLKEGRRPHSSFPVDPFTPIYASIHFREEHLSLVNDAIAMLGAVKETNSYAKHSASVLDLFLRDCRNHARIVKPKPEGHAYQTKTEPITAYESSQYRSPFYPPTQGSLAPAYDRRAAIGDRNVIKKESHDHSNAFSSTCFSSPMDSSTFHHQPSAEYSQRSWHNEHNGDMDLDGSYDSKR
ncbi:hypothetical protein FPSE_03152 [Fusarium pseudograminearum CS3096]|uniref:Zn(2)-C6 fungal-type domain-containing protein n=1 Tax=Fusarium pseudograminearum (strain CS3096) TaxID=1028729 RepID=K3VN84_FUSPC|nr:hypothetical protein FPSE_03152 [Fusarium pseudograminearum CS3096]EKJ76602.1 hypothetical protein FPSE_03152 [Fusarium pseudograminearum CS3096]